MFANDKITSFNHFLNVWWQIDHHHFVKHVLWWVLDCFFSLYFFIFCLFIFSCAWVCVYLCMWMFFFSLSLNDNAQQYSQPASGDWIVYWNGYFFSGCKCMCVSACACFFFGSLDSALIYSIMQYQRCNKRSQSRKRIHGNVMCKKEIKKSISISNNNNDVHNICGRMKILMRKSFIFMNVFGCMHGRSRYIYTCVHAYLSLWMCVGHWLKNLGRFNNVEREWKRKRVEKNGR